MKMIKGLLLVLLCSCLVCCDYKTDIDIRNLGPQAYTMKTLDGLFFISDDTLYLISGTEVSEGSTSQVFIYDVDHDKMIVSQSLPNCRSMTAFCETERYVYFATISGDKGCDLYAWDKQNMVINQCAHFEEKGIYAMACDDSSESLYIATSSPSTLYCYQINQQSVQIICSDFTEENYIRSISWLDGFCYLGVGTKADFIQVDVRTGQYVSLLSSQYRNESFVYSQTIHDSKILFMLSPSCQVIQYDPQSGRMDEIGTIENKKQNMSFLIEDNIEWSTLYGAIILSSSNRTDLSIFTTGNKVSYIDERDHSIHGLDASGNYFKYDENNVVSQIDLGHLLPKQYIIPVEALVYNHSVYIPWRKFIQFDVKLETTKSLFVSSEPQASCITKEGIYTANYTDASVWFYPFGVFNNQDTIVDLNNEDDFLLTKIDNQCRPSQMDITSDDRFLVIGTGPLYGKFGGAVSIYDIKADRLLYTYQNVVMNHSIQSICCSESSSRQVWLGTTPHGENTQPAYLDEPAHLILWDIPTQSILLDIIPDASSRGIVSIVEKNNVVYCVTSAAELRSFDKMTGQLLEENKIDGIKQVLLSQDGTLMAINDHSIMRVDADSLQTDKITDQFTFLTHLMEDPITGYLYVFDETELIEIKHKKR